MESERHAQAKRLFGEACDLPMAERSTRLRQLTRDPELIAYVELLLQQSDADHPRVAQPVLRMLSQVAGSEVQVGDTLDAWRLVSEIGRGGMGAVFRAQRSDGHFEQTAAVKLLHGIPSTRALEYMTRERQILATLTHPNIARLLDGGATPHGQPYLVMDYVEGAAIDDYCRNKNLTLRGVLKLLIEICDASAYALSQDLERYLAREPLQALPRTPVYVAQKLVQRRWPWLAAAVLFAATVGGFTLRVIDERNSTERARTEAERARDNAEQARDSASVAQADALRQRDLANSAQAQALTERDRAVSAERNAREEALTTREVSNFMEGLFSGADPNTTGKQDVSTVAIVERGRERIETELQGQPAIQAAMFTTLARVHENMGRPRDAIALYERAIEAERALKPARPLQLATALSRLALHKSNLSDNAGAEPLAREARLLFARHVPEESQDAADSMRTLSLVLGGLGRFDEAEQLILRAWRIQQKISAPDSDASNIMQHNLAYHYRRAGKLELAETHYRRALESKARRIGEKHPSYLNSLDGLAKVLVRLRRLNEAETLLRRTLALLREIVPGSQKVAFALNNLAQPIKDSGRFSEALQLYAEALALKGSLSGPRTVTYAVTLNSIASTREDMGDFAQAEKEYREAPAILMETLPDSDLLVARLHYNLGALLLRMGRHEEAGALLERAYEVHKRTLGDRHGDTLASGVALVDYHRQAGDIKAAQALLEKMQEMAAALSAPNRIAFLQQRALLGEQLGALDSALHDLREAEQLAAQFYNAIHPRAWLIKLDRAEILQRNKDGAAAAALAAEVLKHVDAVLVAHSPIRERIDRLAARK